MEEQLIEQIKDGVRDILKFVQSRNGRLSEQEKIAIAQALDHAVSRITELRQQQQAAQVQEEPTEPAPPSDKLTMSRPMASSNIHSFAYDPKKKQLYVKFQGDYPQQNGPVYSYQGVPEQAFDIFQKGAIAAKTDGQNKWGKWWVGKQPSLGASFYEAIRQAGFPHQRVA